MAVRVLPKTKTYLVLIAAVLLSTVNLFTGQIQLFKNERIILKVPVLIEARTLSEVLTAAAIDLSSTTVIVKPIRLFRDHPALPRKIK
jgi:hypothetical protein